MSMQRGVPKSRPAAAGGKPEDATLVMEQQGAKIKGTGPSEKVASEPVAPVTKQVEERQAVRDV
ncbi:hypothetical protein IW150_000296, partial [Coemansia sp. RSA 2607]